MKRKFLVLAGGLVLLVAGGSWAVHIVRVRADADALAEQLRLARREGLPTSAAEFAATIQPAAPADNAAPLYRRLAPLIRLVRDVPDIDTALLRRPSPSSLGAAQKFLWDAKPALALIDLAAAKPRCWFDRHWEDGAATLMPEFADMKSSARLLALRGTVAAAANDPTAALADAREIFQVSKHAGEEGTEISALVAEAIYLIGLHELANWCVIYPEELAYRQALAAAIKARPKPDLKREHRGNLVDALSAIELYQTEAGRERLGLRVDDGPDQGDLVLAAFLSKSKAKIEIVKAERDSWAALSLPDEQRDEALDDATSRIDQALHAFAFPRRPEDAGDSSVRARVKSWRATEIEYEALLRGLSKPGVSVSIVSADLKSPYDGTPVRYRFDGKQIQIEIDRGGSAGYMQFKVPPDEVKK